MTSCISKTRKILTAFLVVFTIFSSVNLFAETVSDSVYNYSLDIPEGFTLNEVSDDQMSYHFVHPNYPVQFIIKIYDKPPFDSTFG